MKEYKIIVITGASSGLGKTLADLYKKKDKIVISADISFSQKTLINNVTNEIYLDVTDEKSVGNLIKEVVSKFGQIDIWINNAGVWLPKSQIEEVDGREAQNLFQVNVFGYLYGMKGAILQMKKQIGGIIVNICSTTAFDGMNGSSGSIYVASKYAIRGLTNSVRDELKDKNISIIGVYPGGMKTHLFDAQKPENFEKFMSVEFVAEKIIQNLEKNEPDIELIIKSI
jgi:short-subunit dehydrogenase